MPPTTRILAISPGARTTGVAVVDGARCLGRFEVIPLAAQPTLDAKINRLRLHLAALLDIDKPTEVLCEALEFGRATAANEQLTKAVEEIVTERGLPLRFVRQRDACSALGLEGDLAAGLAARLPVLRRHTSHERSPEEHRYWSRAFTALAIALADSEPAKS